MTGTIRYPAWRASLAYFRDPFAGTAALAAAGDLVRTRLMGWETVVLGQPALVEEVLRGAPELWVKDALTKRMLPVGGLLTSDGADWRRQRRLVNPAFHAGHAQGYAALFARHLEARLSRWGAGQALDLAAEMNALTLGVAVEAFFGEVLGAEEAEAVGEGMDALVRWLASPVAALPWDAPRWLPARRRAEQGLARIRAVVQRILARRAGAPGEDVLGLLLTARDETGDGLSEAEVTDQVITFLVAGHETTSLALVFALHLLGRHPEALARAREEVAAITGPLGLDSLERLRWVRAVVDEALRLHPPAWMLSREPREDTTVGGEPVAAGTMVIVPVLCLHRDPSSWPDPDRFDPERFLGAESLRAPRGSYLPFGLGPRMCVGSRFALLELALMLAGILRAGRLEPLEPALPPLAPSITSRPTRPVPMRWLPDAGGVA